MRQEYRVGSWSVWMTDDEAFRFNHQSTTVADEQSIIVRVPKRGCDLPGYEDVSMSDAIDMFPSFCESVDELDGEDVKPI